MPFAKGLGQGSKPGLQILARCLWPALPTLAPPNKALLQCKPQSSRHGRVEGVQAARFPFQFSWIQSCSCNISTLIYTSVLSVYALRAEIPSLHSAAHSRATLKAWGALGGRTEAVRAVCFCCLLPEGQGTQDTQEQQTAAGSSVPAQPGCSGGFTQQLPILPSSWCPCSGSSGPQEVFTGGGGGQREGAAPLLNSY